MRESGFGAVEWIIGLALMVVPVAAVVLSIAPWFQRATALAAGAAEAARAVVLAADENAADRAVAAIVAEIESRYCDEPCVAITLEPAKPEDLVRGGWVDARAEMRMPGLVVPLIGRVGSFVHAVSHREAVDPYRSLP